MKSYAITFLAIALSVAFQSSAQQAQPPQSAGANNAPPSAASSQSEPVLLDSIVVQGVQPGPGLWHVTKGDHQLWILGSLWPLPNSIVWNSETAVDLVSKSQEVIWEPYFVVDADVGFFQKVYLGYRMYRAEKNPDGKKLKDVLSPQLYARWNTMRQRYLPNDGGVESKRPLLAADALFKAAVRQASLGQSRIISPPINAAIKEQGIQSTRPHVKVTLTDPRAALKEAQQAVLNDSVCMEATLDAIEQDLPRMVTNANAWATGDLERITFEQITRRDRACSNAFSEAEFARKRGIPDIEASLKESWLKAADTALANNESTFAVVPMQDIVGLDGYAARLRAKGYTVEVPEL